jgi:hypothetical protein
MTLAFLSLPPSGKKKTQAGTKCRGGYERGSNRSTERTEYVISNALLFILQLILLE